jgi:hypothetical protein
MTHCEICRVQLIGLQRYSHRCEPEIIWAQHEETGVMWRGSRCDLPRRYFEVRIAALEIAADIEHASGR